MRKTVVGKAGTVLLVAILVTLIMVPVSCQWSVPKDAVPRSEKRLDGNITIEPQSGIYCCMKEILPFPVLVFLHGAMRFTVNINDSESGIDRVVFFINGAQQFIDTEAPYQYTLTGGWFLKFTISAWADGMMSDPVVVYRIFP